MNVTLVYKWGRDPEEIFVYDDGTTKLRRDRLVASDDDAGLAIERVAAEPSTAAKIADVSPIPPSGLETADYVVDVGRGVNTPEKFSVARRLAEAMGAELSGTMPGVRDFGNFEEGADYVGLSGVRLNSKVYVTLGISRSTPHLVGFANCERTVCINKDENAQLFDYADYGIVTDFEEVVPELVKAPS